MKNAESLKRLAVNGFVIIFFLLLLVSWLFGAEPQLLTFSTEKIPLVSFNEYMQGSTKKNGDNFCVKVLTTIAYPGYLVGASVHNLTTGSKSGSNESEC